ncbi:MAG: hypothetical protein WDZ90_02025 [Candidatus Paceibacterota bacterium]
MARKRKEGYMRAANNNANRKVELLFVAGLLVTVFVVGFIVGILSEIEDAPVEETTAVIERDALEAEVEVLAIEASELEEELAQVRGSMVAVAEERELLLEVIADPQQLLGVAWQVSLVSESELDAGKTLARFGWGFNEVLGIRGAFDEFRIAIVNNPTIARVAYEMAAPTLTPLLSKVLGYGRLERMLVDAIPVMTGAYNRSLAELQPLWAKCQRLSEEYRDEVGCERTEHFARTFEAHYGVSSTSVENAWWLGFLLRRDLAGGVELVSTWKEIFRDYSGESAREHSSELTLGDILAEAE